VYNLKSHTFLSPFSIRLWIAVAFTIVSLTTLLIATQHLRLLSQYAKDEDLSILNSALFIIGAFLQQGKVILLSSL
jgi:hypothetical protein